MESGCVDVNGTDADLPSLVAVTVVLPAASAVAITVGPVVGERLTTAVLPTDQLMGRPFSTLLFASYVVAVYWTWRPDTSVALAGLTSIRATAACGCCTVTTALPLTPFWLVAVSVAWPAAMAVTWPVRLPAPEIVATLVAPEFHVTDWPVTTLLEAS
jgi:hypothetical protein